MKRRERTRQLIELGGLVAKADLIELTGDDRAVLLGLLIEAAATLRGEGREQQDDHAERDQKNPPGHALLLPECWPSCTQGSPPLGTALSESDVIARRWPSRRP